MTNTVPFSPIALVGTITLLVAYVVAAYCVAAGLAGNARKNRRLVTSSVYGLYGFGALVGLASAMMIYAFVTHDFSIKYVAATSDVSMSTWYKVTAFWGGLDGSLLFWVLVLALFSVVAVLTNAKRHRDMIGYVVATIMVVQVFFISLLIFTKNPFSTYLTSPPVDGQGLNPLLQNYWMVIHPPSLYVGFVAATIPFAFGMGALASGRLDDLWIGSVRVWMLICFGFLSLGLILGGRWAYEELGWGGYWAWDPVENAGFIPWFTATAFLHSSIIQEQRGGMKRWNLFMVILTFFLTIFGTFMTRSGIVQSVHAFGEDNVLALQFIVFMALILIVAIGLVVYRWTKLSSTTHFESFISREFAFLVNNWILLGCAFFVLFATMFPTITQALDSSRVSVGIDFFNRMITPFALILLFLTGAAPLLAWRKTTREKLYRQFLFPTALMTGGMILLIILFPQVLHRSAFFSERVQLPIALVNFGLCSFVAGSIGQEFYRGMTVRQKQTGGYQFTSMLGLVLSKRRKYGGYIVHLGVAVMFVGFGGKAYDKSLDRTIDAPLRAAEDRGAAELQLSPAGLGVLNTLTELQLRDDVGMTTRAARNVVAARPRAGFANADQLEKIPYVGTNVMAALERYAKDPHHVIWKVPVANGMTAEGAIQVLAQFGITAPRTAVTEDRGVLTVTVPYQLDVEQQMRIRNTFADLVKVEPDKLVMLAKPSAWFEFKDYRFVYEKLIDTSDDHKSAVTAQVTIWHDGEPVGTVYPAKWDYRKGSEATTEVAIRVRPQEDVYVVLTGYDLDSKLANFRIYVNPLISWVWLGFLILAFGTLVCLIPTSLVERAARGGGPKSRLGRAGEIGILVVILSGVIAGFASQARAQGGEHTPSGRGMGDAGAGYAAMHRPSNGTAERATKEILCHCGCPRESVFDCKCATAADLRREIMGFLDQRDGGGKRIFDLATQDGREKAYEAVRDRFAAQYGEQVLATPRSKLSWLLPSLALVGGLGLIFIVGRRFIGRGKAVADATPPTKTRVEDEPYADKLDDELADTD
ncbi:MAG: cytochrome c-type biogenesis CcmF C-terminal domain-containing protein [Kofleriaceae bacterium]